jgi:hypothetical protein
MIPNPVRPTREQRRQLERDRAKFPAELVLLPREQWERALDPRIAVWRSRDFLVQVFKGVHPDVLVRLSVNITSHNGITWHDGIAWDELQRIKAQCGYAEHDAVEVYPAQSDAVTASNMRHLWVLHGRLPYAWGDGRANLG